MEAGFSVGKSMLVPSIKELATKLAETGANEIPSRYLRPNLDPPLFSSDAAFETVQLPVISLDALLLGEKLEFQKLDAAGREWGFFQVLNHGASNELIDGLKEQTKKWFSMPMEDKKKFWQSPGDLEGFGQTFVVSEEQKLEWCDVFYLTAHPKRIRKDELFSKIPLPYRDTLNGFCEEVRKLALKLLDCLEKALGINDVGYLQSVFGEGRLPFNMNYYPPCPFPDKVIGSNPHSDASGLPILIQLNGTDGLQVKKDGEWIPVRPLPDAFIVNIGGMLEIVTNGVYRSVEHRVVVNGEKERISVAAFYNPWLDQVIAPAPYFINSDNPAQYRSIKTVDYTKGRFTRKLNGRSYIDSMTIYDGFQAMNSNGESTENSIKKRG